MSETTEAIKAKQSQIKSLQSEIHTLLRAAGVLGAKKTAKPKPKQKSKRRTAKQKSQAKRKIKRKPWSAAAKRAMSKRIKASWAKRRKAKG